MLVTKYEQKIKRMSESTIPNIDSSTSISKRMPPSQPSSDLPKPIRKMSPIPPRMPQSNKTLQKQRNTPQKPTE